jgi:hypothetical protein
VSVVAPHHDSAGGGGAAAGAVVVEVIAGFDRVDGEEQATSTAAATTPAMTRLLMLVLHRHGSPGSRRFLSSTSPRIAGRGPLRRVGHWWQARNVLTMLVWLNGMPAVRQREGNEMRTYPARGSTALETPEIRPAIPVRQGTVAPEVSR